MTTYSDKQIAVLDALHEVSITRPEIASDTSGFFVKASTLRAAFDFIPDEYRLRRATLGETFVASVIANATAIDRSPYTVALFALDA
jgi:hypothetical protein